MEEEIKPQRVNVLFLQQLRQKHVMLRKLKKPLCPEKYFTKYIKTTIFFTVAFSIIITWSLYQFMSSSPKYPLKKLRDDRNFDEFVHVPPKPWPKIERKIVHLDLKGAPPKISYFQKLFPLLSKMGATGLLIEYEDMFPYYGPIIGEIPAGNAYSVGEIALINKLAHDSHLKVIPLIQTFGHMEFILKLSNYSALREIKDYPQAVCPTHPKTLPLIFELIRQIVMAHPNATEIHIGADEVYYLGICERCFMKMNDNKWTKEELFLEHIKSVASFIRKNYPHLTVLMWDDEFRNMRVEILTESNIGQLIEPVVWKYSKDVYSALGPVMWSTYSEIFPRMWVASAFKGATGSDKFTTDVSHHLENHRSWMRIVAEYSEKIQFRGIFITGWQRYDHFSILCELLPVGLPSLAMCLRLISQQSGAAESPLSPPSEVTQLLQCDRPYALMGLPFGTPKCSFPGAEVLDGALRLQVLVQDFDQLMLDSRVRGWIHDYNVDHAYSNPQYVASALEDLDRFKMELNLIGSDMVKGMSDVYDNHTVVEWFETFIRPLQKKINALWDAKEKLLYKDHWPKRPLTSKNEL